MNLENLLRSVLETKQQEEKQLEGAIQELIMSIVLMNKAASVKEGFVKEQEQELKENKVKALTQRIERQKESKTFKEEILKDIAHQYIEDNNLFQEECFSVPTDLGFLVSEYSTYFSEMVRMEEERKGYSINVSLELTDIEVIYDHMTYLIELEGYVVQVYADVLANTVRVEYTYE